jgi:predicted phage terminase large subunit-like protein
MVLIEAKASGDPLIKDLHMGGIPSIAINPSQDGDKIKRVHFITPLIEGGRVWVPARGPKFDSLLPYADEFVELAAAFPNLESNDVIDTMSQALKKLKDGLLVLNPRDERPIPPVMIEPVEY